MTGTVVPASVPNDNEDAFDYQDNPCFCKVKNCEEDAGENTLRAGRASVNRKNPESDTTMAPMFV